MCCLAGVLPGGVVGLAQHHDFVTLQGRLERAEVQREVIVGAQRHTMEGQPGGLGGHPIVAIRRYGDDSSPGADGARENVEKLRRAVASDDFGGVDFEVSRGRCTKIGAIRIGIVRNGAEPRMDEAR
jgi:hypothetical protein